MAFSHTVLTHICKPIENNFGKYDMVLTLTFAIATLSFNTLTVTVANETNSV